MTLFCCVRVLHSSKATSRLYNLNKKAKGIYCKGHAGDETCKKPRVGKVNRRRDRTNNKNKGKDTLPTKGKEGSSSQVTTRHQPNQRPQSPGTKRKFTPPEHTPSQHTQTLHPIPYHTQTQHTTSQHNTPRQSKTHPNTPQLLLPYHTLSHLVVSPPTLTYPQEPPQLLGDFATASDWAHQRSGEVRNGTNLAPSNLGKRTSSASQQERN